LTEPRPRIARVITRLNIGGPSIQAIDLTRELAPGFDTLLIHGRLGDGEGDMTTLHPLGGARTQFIADLIRPISPLRDLLALWRIYRALCRWRPEIVHTHMAKAGTLGRLAALFYNETWGRKRRACLVHTYHGHVFEGYFGSRSTNAFLAVERWLGRRTDAIIAISCQVRQDLVHTFKVVGEQQVVTIPLGFDLSALLGLTYEDRKTARLALGIPPDVFAVITVGRLTEVKQHAAFLEMAARLARQPGNFMFLLVGDGELRPHLERLANDLGIAARTRFLGWRGDLATIYGAADAFVLTSRSEGTPVALIEAMAAGVPSVSTDVGGVRDVIASEHLGMLVAFGDHEGLATAVQTLARSPHRRSESALRARASVRERFDLQRLVADISGLYRRLTVPRTTLQ
jgi:glycosyltransferase involved in cell wall biosynthesis